VESEKHEQSMDRRDFARLQPSGHSLLFRWRSITAMAIWNEYFSECNRISLFVYVYVCARASFHIHFLYRMLIEEATALVELVKRANP
jgi:hypothetical protein